MRPRVAALVPVLDCASAVAGVVRGVRRHVDEVLVVDDASTDNSAELARRAGARVVVHPHNLGKGPTLRTGLSVLLAESWTHILMLDGDGQHDPDDAPKFLAAATEADFVLGTRLWQAEAIPARRYWTNYIGTRALCLMTGLPLEDSQCGYRLAASGLLRRMGLVGTRYSIDSELLIRAGKLRAPFAHVPVRVIYAGTPSHYRPLADTVHIVFSTIRFKIDEGDLRRDPGPAGWRAFVAAPLVLPPLGN